MYNLRICKRNTAERGQNSSTAIPAAQGRFTGSKGSLSSKVPAATIVVAPRPQKYFNTKIFPTKITEHENFPNYGIDIHTYIHTHVLAST